MRFLSLFPYFVSSLVRPIAIWIAQCVDVKYLLNLITDRWAVTTYRGLEDSK
jgi:hypothetical protein